MSQNKIFIYALRDEESDKGFVLAAVDDEIDLEKIKTDKVGVFNINSVKGKPYSYTIDKKATKVKVDLLISLVDSDYFTYTEKTRTLVFTKKNYESVSEQIVEDLEEEENSESKDEDVEEEEEEVKSKRTRGAQPKKAAPKQKAQKKSRSNSKNPKNAKESESEEEEEQEEEEEAPKKRGKAVVAKKGKQQKKEVSEEENEEEEEEEEESEQPKAKRTRGRKPGKKSVSAEKEDKEEEEEEQEEEEEDTKTKAKKGKKTTKATPAASKKDQKKKGKKAKSTDDEESDEKEASEEDAPKSKKAAKKKEAAKKFVKGKSNPNITSVTEVDETFEGESGEIQDSCCSFCTNNELLRAIHTGNHALLKKLVNSKSKISTLFAKRGPDSDQTTLEIILANKDKKALEIYLAALQKKSEIQLAPQPGCSLDEVNTGSNDRFAYGVPTRKVNCSRGGKEGNNAFVADLNAFVSVDSWQTNERLLVSLLENETEVHLLEFLRGLPESGITNALLEKAYIAVRAGNRKTAAYLIEQANKVGGYGFNKVHEQVLSLNDVSKMEEFRRVSATKKSTGVYANNGYGYGGAQGIITPIHCAAINPNPEFIQKLLELAPEFSIPDDMMRKPIHYAATCSGPGPLNYLIKQGVDTREGDKKKITPLMLACQYGRTKNVEILLAGTGKSNPDARTRDGMRAIHYAAFYGHLSCVKLMVEQGGVPIDSPGAKRMTALHIAASRGHYDLVEYLLEKEAKINLKDKFKRSPIILATANGQLKVLSLLLMKGGSFNDADSSNNYPVHYAAAYGFQSCLDLLKLAGADLNPQNSWNLTPLSVAMAKGHFGMVKKLLNNPECDVNCTDVEGRTIISRATQNLSQKTIDQFEFILKEKKANPNKSDIKGQSPLHYLCGLSKDKYVAQRQKEENKLNISAAKKYQEEYEQIVEKAIKILLECGADINLPNILGQPPIYLAIQQKNFFVFNLLISKAGVEFGFTNQIDKNIFHCLTNLILEGPAGIQQFKTIFQAIKNDSKLDVKTMLNTVDYNGFSPILSYVRHFSSGALGYWDNVYQRVYQEIFEKKGGVKKDGKALKTTKHSNVSTDGSVVQITPEELAQCRKEASQELKLFEQEFQELVLYLQAEGADVEVKVAKLKKFRNKMDVEKKENEEEQEECDMWGNPIVKVVKKFKPEYCCFGEYNIFNLALNNLSLSYLTFFADKFPQLVKGIDYLGRNVITRFITWNSDSRSFSDLEKTDDPKDILTWLCSLGIDVNHKDMAQQTPLLTSINLKRYNFTKILISKGAQLQTQDFFGNVPLITAINQIQSNDLDFVTYLLENGADPNYTDNNKRNALHHAVSRADKGANASFDLENLLIKHKADVNASDILGRVPLHYAFVSLNSQTYEDSKYDPFETVSSLCNQPNIQINAKDNLGKTPLHYAAQKNSTISAIYMLEKHAKIDEEDNFGNTPLSIAFRFKCSEITTTFIQNSADTSKFITVIEQEKLEKKMEEEEPRKKTRRGRNNYVNYGNRNLNANGDSGYGGIVYNAGVADKDSIINKLLAEEVFKPDPFIDVIEQVKACEEKIEKGEGQAVFKEFQYLGPLGVGKHSFFKAAISYQWQGIAYLLLIKSKYNLFNALVDAINIDLYQLSITLLNKYPDDKTVANQNAEKQNLIHVLCQRPPRDINLQTKLLDILIARSVDFKQIDSKKNLSLHYAANYQHLASRLLSLGLDCNQFNEEQNSPFSIALQTDAKSSIRNYQYYKPDLSKRFLAQPIGFNDKIAYSPFVFLVANRYKDITLLQELLDLGSNINEVDGNERNGLYYAIHQNSKKLVQFLLHNKAIDVNHVDKQGKNAVHYVVNPVEFGSYENVEILKILKEASFDLNHKDNEGNTPLSYALQQDSGKMAAELKSYGVDQVQEKKLPKRAPTSIVASANYPEEEVDFEDDAKKFVTEAAFDQFKEFFEQRNRGDIVKLDSQVTSAYQKPENYVILDENNEPYNLLMTKVDLGYGGYAKYVFYIMQIILDKNSGVFILFTRWGRIGSTGQMQHTPFPTKEAAVKEFSKIFSQKSGNEWTNRHQFKKQEQKYQLIQFETDNFKKAFSVKPYNFNELKAIKSTLDKPIFDFVKDISSAEIFKQAYRQLAVSEYYLPLSKLSKTTLMEAQGILADLKDLSSELQTLRTKLTEGNNMQKLLEKEEAIMKLSNRYYELVPRATSKWEPAQPLNDQYSIANEQRLIDNLLDFEAAIKIIMGSYTRLTIEHPIDYCFNALNIRMKSVEIEHPEFKMIKEYIGRTNPKVHAENSKAIRNIFAVERRGEAERIKQFQGYTKKLLWHGSGVQNFLSILSFGLRINGIQAQKSGSSLGDGIYFADLFSKASGYANNNGVGITSQFLLLCEVAVGKEQHIKTNNHYQQFANRNYQLQKGYNSVKLVGNQCPDEKSNLILQNGTIAPLGSIVDFNQVLTAKLKEEKEKKSQTTTDTKVASSKKTKGVKLVPVPQASLGGKAPRKILAAKAARKSVPAAFMRSMANEESEEESASQEIEEEEEEQEKQDIEIEGVEEEENENEEDEENENDDEDEEEESDPYEVQDNNLYGVPEQKNVPFHQTMTQYQQSEYVVFNSAQVRIRYLVEINN